MLIDLSKPPTTTDKTQSTSARPPQTIGTSVLPIMSGETVQARVTKVALVTPEQLEAIKNKTVDTLTQAVNKPSEQKNASQSQGLSAIANITSTGIKTLKPEVPLHLAELRVNTKSFTVLTDLLLQKQDMVTVKINQNQQLEIIAKAPFIKTSELSLNKPTNATAAEGNTQTTTVTPKIEAQIQQVLRELLPQQGKPDLVNNLNSIHALLMQAPKSKENITVINLLNTIKSTAINVTGAPKLVELKQAFMNSGNFLEAKLAAALNINENNNNTFVKKNSITDNVKLALNQDIKANLLKLADVTSRAVANEKSGTHNMVRTPSLNVLADAINTQTKTTLNVNTNPLLTTQQPSSAQTVIGNTEPSLKVSDQVIKNLSSTTKPEAATKSHIKPGSNFQHIPTFILQFLGNQTPNTQSFRESKLLQTQLLVLVHQLSLVNLAKIRLNQVRPETHSKGGGDTATPLTGSLSVDLPTRHEGILHNTHIEIDSETQSSAHDTCETRKDKQWNVKLNIAINESASIYIHLKFYNDNLVVKLWADKVNILNDAKQKFSDIKNSLTAQGVNIESIEYFEGKPTNTDNAIKYTLVDIKT